MRRALVLTSLFVIPMALAPASGHAQVDPRLESLKEEALGSNCSLARTLQLAVTNCSAVGVFALGWIVAQYAKRIVEVRDGRIIRDHAVGARRSAADDLLTREEPDDGLEEAA